MVAISNGGNEHLADLDSQIASETAALAAQTKQAASDAAASQTRTGTTQTHSWWSVEQAMTISCVVLVFGLMVTLVAAWLVRKGTSHTAVLRVFGTILILVFSVFLVVAGYDDKQIAPVLGLLGTVAGYLLGKTDKETAPSQPPQN
jgi:hypothetical protein